MRRLLFLLLLIIPEILLAVQPDSSMTIMRRRSAFQQGESYISFGTGIYGLNNPVSRNHALLTNFKNAGLPPLFFRYETAISDNVGIGGTFFFQMASFKWDKSVMAYNNETWTYEPTIYQEKFSGASLGFLGRMNIHFAGNRTNDAYFGFGIGYEFFMMKMTSDDPLVDDRVPERLLPFSTEVVFGYRSYVGDNTAIYAEAGYGKMLLNLGITVWLDR